MVYQRVSWMSTGADLTSVEVLKKVDEINERFAVARDEIELALESVGTTYFNDEATEALSIGRDVIQRYESLLSAVPTDKRSELQRSLGLKMGQLKAELENLKNAGAD
jgi:hypothetical protein